MEAILIKSKYKVTHILHAQEGYAAFQAVDIESREKNEYLLNVYEGELIRRYIDCFDRLRHCPHFVSMFMDGGSLVAAFTFEEGRKIDDVFFLGASHDWRTKLRFAGLVFHQALSISDFPPEISCAAMLSRNIVVWPKDQRLSVNYLVPPMEGMNERELLLLMTDQIKKIFLPCFSTPTAESAFLARLESGAFHTLAQTYSAWLEAEKSIAGEYEAIEKRGAISRTLYLLVINIKRWFKKAFRKRGPR